ncbi:MAG: hypothetical protein KAJ24_03970 [Candidatus Aenigmarchaeota archaeon]|nr:hypothetical protein [Candidatus Aenigmarchaeota archaeon]
MNAKPPPTKINQKKIVAVLILFIAFFLLYGMLSFRGAMASSSAENMFFKSQSQSYDAFVEISDPKDDVPSIGFAADVDMLNFGIVPSGGNYARKVIHISNNARHRARVLFEAEGDIKTMIEFDETRYLVEPGASEEAQIILRTQNSTLAGNYSGSIIVTKIASKNALSNIFIKWL